MALVVNDRVKETSTTTGTGTLSLAGAVQGFETFVAGIGNSNTTYYTIVNEDGAFEVGIGTVTDAGTDTLSRTTILSSSNSDSAVNFAAGTKDVFCTLPASKAVIEDASNNVTLPADLSVGDDLTIEGGVIDFKSNSGSPAALRMYCEVSNAHYQTLAPQPHSAAASNTLRLPDSGDSGTQDLVAVDISQTLTNKTLTTPVISSISNTGTLTLPTSTDTLVGRATTDTLTNKSIDASQLTGTVANARLDAQLQDVAGLATTAGKIIQGDGSNFALSAYTLPTSDGSAGKVLTTDGSGAVTFETPTTGDITSVVAGSGLTGGATSGAATLNVGAGNLIDVQADQVDVDLSELTTSTSNADGDFFVVVDSSNGQRKLTKGNINNSGFNNDAGYTTNTGDITSVVAGSGLTGGATSGAATLNVGAGTGIDVAADAVSVDVSDFMTNGSNNRVVTATGADGMNAEANMQFDGSTLTVTGDIVPGANDSHDLGASDNVWRNLYTGDLHLSNEAKSEGNAVDGTKGSWTIQEGAEDLYLFNNKSGKKYKFKLEEV
jgi:hypothetical protein